MANFVQYGKRMMGFGNQAQLKMKADEEVLIKRQIFLDSIDDIFSTIEAHLSYENDTRRKVKNSLHKRQIFDNVLLKRVDSLMTTIQIFSLSCFSVKLRNDIDTLKLGKLACKQKLDKMKTHGKQKYKAFVDIMYYVLDGNRIAFPKRKQTHGELNPNFNGKNMNDVLSQLIGGQHVVDTNRKKYKANTKDLKKKYDYDLTKAKKLPKITKVQLPEMDELYQVFNIKNQEFVSRNQKTKENKKKLNIKNAFIKSGYYSINAGNNSRMELEIPFPCLILEDMSGNDNKILVELAYPWNLEFRPYKKDVFWCQDEEARKKIIKIELKHFEKFYYLSLPENKSYKSIADPLDIDEAIARYYQRNDNNDFGPNVDTLHNNADSKDPCIEDINDADGKFNHSKIGNILGNFDDDNKDGSINTTKKVHDVGGHGRHGQHNHDNCCQHNVVKKGNHSNKHVKPDLDKIHNDENLQNDIDMMDANKTGSVKPVIPIVRRDNVNDAHDSDGDFVDMTKPRQGKHQRTPSDQAYDTYNRLKMRVMY